MLRRCATRKPRKLANKFILVANIEASDGGEAIVAGNERVIRARLSDAKFFYETDLKTRLEDRLPKFDRHRVPREARHAGASASSALSDWPAELAPLVGADVEQGRSAPRGCARPICSPRWSANFPSCRA